MIIVFIAIIVSIQWIKTQESVYKLIDDNHNILETVQDPICSEFSKPIIPNNDNLKDLEYTVQSPKYPNHYPVNIDCIHIIKAPMSNMIIKLEFRETFEIEESKQCLHDFLQINDGPFGFSTMITKLCGKEIDREIIESSGHYLWLRFYSDKTLTGRGFKFTYKFLDFDTNRPSIKICYRKLTIPNGHSALLNSDNIKKYQVTNDFKDIQECVFDISVNEESSIFIFMAHLNSSKMKNFDQFIEIYDRITTHTSYSNNKNYFLINEKSNIEKLLLKHKRTIVRIAFRSIASIMSFQLVLTALVRKSVKDNCSKEEHMCEKSYCMSNKLVCNNLRNCPNGDDEICINGRLAFNNEKMIVVVPSSATEISNKEHSEKDHYRLHGLILGSISLFLIFMLMCCIIHSIRQSKLNSKNHKKQGPISVNVRDISKFENKVLKPSNPSMMTLTTEIMSKKVYNQPRLKSTSNESNRTDLEPTSIFYKDRDYDYNIEQVSFACTPNRNSCSPDNGKRSTSISSSFIYMYIYKSKNAIFYNFVN